MPALSTELPAVPPNVTAALVLAAIPVLATLGLPHPTVAATIDATGATKTRAHELKNAILALLPTLLRPPGRPPAPPASAADTGAISRAVNAYLRAHPGAARTVGTRNEYTDGFRHLVLDLAEQHVHVQREDFAEAVGVPLDTFKDWLSPRAEAPTEPTTPPPEAAVDPTNARIATIVEARRTWEGGFKPFCRFVRAELGIPYGLHLIRRILTVHAGRRPTRRPGRSPDEKAARHALLQFHPGAQWFQDGSPIAIRLNDQVHTFNWELGVDGFSGAFVGSSLRKEEDARAVVSAFEDGVEATGSKPIALTTDNRAPNHAPEVAAALGDTLHIRTTLGRPQNDAPIEGAFGLFQQTVPPLVVRGRTDEDLARAVLALVLTVWCRATNHRPRNDRNGRSRVQIYQGDEPTTEQIALARTQLEDRRRRQELAFRTRQARLNPVVRALLDEVFLRLGFADPTGNVKDAIARYPHDTVLAGIATFEVKRDACRLPVDAGPRYLLGIVRHITERDEGRAITEHLWRLRLAARDAALVRLDEARRATSGSPGEQTRAFVDRALAEDSPLVRSFWLAAVGEVIAAQPQTDQHGLFETASRRIHATFRIDAYERQAAVRTLGTHFLPVP